MPPAPASAPLLVTGACGPAGRSLLAQLAERGLPALGADMAPPPAGDASCPVLPVPPARDPGFPAALRELVAAHGVRTVVPTVSEELPVLAALAGRLGEGVRIVVSAPEAVAIADDKLRTAELLDAAGVAVPAFAPGSLPAAEATARTGLPLVAKPRVSRGARGVRVVRRAEELGAPDPGCVLQAFAPGAEYAPVVYLPLPDGALRAAGAAEPFVAVLEKTGLSAGEVGNATGVRRVDGPDTEDVARLAVAAARAAGLYGPVDVDVRRDAAGTARVLELNARFGANSSAAPELLGALLRDLGLPGEAGTGT
ncbi:MAG: ATP-grasp domain-containing protein [Pseudoclavibacter sp.]|nr:ATP-grasp domain-containing protein [Pseudoclavibacter sp.]